MIGKKSQATVWQCKISDSSSWKLGQ